METNMHVAHDFEDHPLSTFNILFNSWLVEDDTEQYTKVH